MNLPLEIAAGPRPGEVLAHAPGKLFVAGEYAVVEAGRPAVLVAVDRRLSVTLRPAAVPQELTGRGWSYVAAARAVMDELARAHGRPDRPFTVRTLSDLEDADLDGHGPRKYGLGSSAAVTAAAVVALNAWHELDLTAEETLRAALLATLRVNPRASGADVAACLLGGWVSYSSPDREWVAAGGDAAAVVTGEWPGLSARRLPTPSFTVRAGWSGRPASTTSLVAAVRAGGAMPAWFTAESDRCVAALEAAVVGDSSEGAAAAVRAARANLRALGDAVGVAIETPALTALAEAADGLGLAAKSSGAGGGDCGVALLPAGRGEDDDALAAAWRAVGIQPLDVALAGGTALVPCEARQ